MNSRIFLEFIALAVIIAVLSYGAVGVYTYGKANANNEKRLEHLGQIEDALERFYFENGAYPVANGQPQNEKGELIAALSTAKNMLEALVQGGYLESLPVDPDPVYGYLYLVANEDNFEGGDKWQYYTVIAHSEGPDVPAFYRVGNASSEFEMTEESWSALVTLGQTQNTVQSHGIRAESGQKIAPDGGEGILWH